MKHLLCKYRDQSLDSQNHREAGQVGQQAEVGKLARLAKIGELHRFGKKLPQ